MLSLALLFVLMFFSPFRAVNTSLGEERTGLCASSAFVNFARVDFRPSCLLLGVGVGCGL